MAESASHISHPNESDFHDSHPLDDEKSPSIGDLSDFDSFQEADKSEHSVGDVNSVALPAEDDVLGDITLLEEAFNEMDEDAEEANSDSSLSAMDNAALDQLMDEELGTDEDNSSEDIPVLSEKVDEPTAETDIIAETPIEESIPVLDQPPTVFSADNAEAAEVNVESDINLSEMQASESAAEEASADVSVMADIEEEPETITGFSAMDTDESLRTAIDDLSVSDIEDVDDSGMAESVDDKLAEMQAQSSEMEINEMPTEDSLSGITTEFANELDSVALSTVLSNFEEDNASQAATTTPHRVSVGGDNGFTLNIPFELHSQLSKKIDELVIDATTSLTNELNAHLSSRLEKVLSNAVESVLPALANQLVNELRSEINTRVNEQLPMIINDVLGKTSLKDK
ncbi:MAG: hypothetical protein R3240_02535 [Gammaproteobacteria bacterium]|nr:hypothetical protein [Gammaproteobacteria bacterium]